MKWEEYRYKIKDSLDKFEFNKEIPRILKDSIKNNQTIFVGGNGGSASIAQHYVCDFSKGANQNWLSNFKRYKAICLSNNLGYITAISNDEHYDEVFRQQLINLAKPKDILILISSSGNSPNVVKALEYAKEIGMITIGVSGFTGGKLKEMCDYSAHIDNHDYEVCENIHDAFGQFLATHIRDDLKESKGNVLVTGNKGYIGEVLTQMLLEKGYEVTGLDTGFYNDCKLEQTNYNIKQINKDTRNITKEDLKDIDYVIHLAALSNDPLGELNPALTGDINFQATKKLAHLAKEVGVKRFIYSSSQSMYGISKLDEELDEDNSEKNAITVYAQTKWDAELELRRLGSDDFIVTCFRPSTVFGASPNLRCDIVFNNLVACGYTTGKIEIKSDGTPWRPVIHVKDVSNAFIAGLEAPKELVANQSFNVGIEKGNYTVRELAEAAQKVVGEHCDLTFTGEHGSDSRTYKVSFKKINTVLKDYWKPEWDLIKGGTELVEFFKKINFTEEMFRGRKCNRLAQLNYLVEKNRLDHELYWKNKHTQIKQAVILAGGIGERLRPLTNTIPKPMVKLNDKPFLEHMINMLKENGIEEIIMLLGYLPEKITEYFGDGSKFGVKIKYSIGNIETQTGKRVKDSEEWLDEHFLLMYCDNYWPLNLKKLVNFYDKQNVLASVTIYTNKDNFSKSNMKVNEQGYVDIYDKERKTENLSGVEIGFFILNKEIVNWMPTTNFSFEREIIPKLIEKNQLAGYLTDQRYYSIGDLVRLPKTERFLKSKKVILLDRDGVICKKAPKADYIKKWEEFEFLPGAIEAMKLMEENNYEIYIITNQPGIARGVMTKEDLNIIHKNMSNELSRHGVKIKGIYQCTHGWDDGCYCRKPKPGMLFQASKDHYIDLSKAVFIGDDVRDAQTGEAAGVRTLLTNPEKGLLDVTKGII